MARQYVISVGTSATLLEGTQFPGWLMLNNGANPIYLGDSAVTTATGWPVATTEIFTPAEYHWRSLTGRVIERLYGIVAASTEEARIFIPGRVNTAL